MKSERTNLLLLIILAGMAGSFAGCGGPKYNQDVSQSAAVRTVPADEVQLFAAGQPPARRFEVVGPVSTDSRNYRKPMQEAAGKLGANAVVGVHDFRAPRTLGIQLQSGIAVRWVSEGQTAPATPAKSGVAFVALIEPAVENTNTFAELRDSMLLLGGLQLQLMGYCPIFVSTPLPSGTNVPATVTFDLLKDSEARLCEKMLVLRLTHRDQTYAGVGGWADLEMKAALVSRADNSILWTNTTRVKNAGIGPFGSITVASTGFTGQAAATTISKMPKNR